MTPEQKSLIKPSEVISIPDDKNPNKINKVLVLGVANPSLEFHNPGMVKSLNVIDKIDKKDTEMQEKDMKETYKVLNEQVQAFKKDAPQGGVILESHTGKTMSKIIAKNVPGINLILNAHDHIDDEETVTNPDGSKTLIVSLGANNDKANGIHMLFDDNGAVSVTSKTYYKKKDNEVSPDNPFKVMYDQLFVQDSKPLFNVKVNQANGAAAPKELSSEDIRYNPDNPISNCVADTVLEQIKKTNPDVQAFGVLSCTIRGSLPVGPVSNLQLMDLFSGCSTPLSVVHAANLSGADIANMIVENVRDNLINKERNPLIIWSGIKFDKEAMAKVEKEKPPLGAHGKALGKVFPKWFTPFITDPYIPYIKIKNEKGEYEPLNKNKIYKIATTADNFNVPNLRFAVAKKNSFKPLPGNNTLYDLFLSDVKAHNNQLEINLKDKSK